jgi:putative salt-induced outer membrane protein YdiY
MKLLLAGLLLGATAARAADAKPWKNSAELSFVSANGNSKTQTTSVKDAFSYDFNPLTKLELEAGGLGARSEGKVIAEQYFALEKVSRKFDDRDYVFEKYRWDRNVFAGILHRHDFSVGVGRELWKTPKDLLIGEAAPGYANEERLNDKRKSYASARAYAKYTRELSATAKFSQDAEYLTSLADARDAHAGTETALTAALTTTLSVKNSFVWKHDARPPAGKRKDDTLLSVALIATF